MVIAVIDSTIREESRTRLILNGVLDHFKNIEFKYFNLNSFEIPLTNSKNFLEKNNDEFFFNVAKEIAQADAMIVAAPFWDMTYPALLKAFFEKISILDVMFADGPDSCIGISHNKFMFYITTRGMNIKTDSPLDGATKSLRALCALWGIPKLVTLAANNMDYLSAEEIDQKIQKTIARGVIQLRRLINGKD